MPAGSIADPPLELLPVFREGESIPKIIHQVFPGKPPPVVQENIEKIRALNPGWDYRLYDDEDMVAFIKANYGSGVLAYYHSIHKEYGASRADFFRYLLMYKVGGVYLDIKSSLDEPLDKVLRPDDVYVLSRWNNGQSGGRHAPQEGWGRHGQLKRYGGDEFQQWHVIAAPGHPFLRAVIEKVERNIEKYNPILHGTGRRGTLWISGPIAYTLAIAPLLNRYRHRIAASQDDLGLAYSIFGTSGARLHKALFKTHYTELTDPLTDLFGIRKILWTLFQPLQKHLFRPVGHVAAALARRLSRQALHGG